MPNDNKKNKRLNIRYDSGILKYKLLQDELDLVEEENLEGSLDLIFRINSFSKKLSSKKSEELHKEFGLERLLGIEKTPESTIPHDDMGEVVTSSSNKSDPGGWQKKLLRQIVKKTHPDKVINYPENDKVFYTEVCREATQAYNAGRPVLLMSKGHDVRIKPHPITSEQLNLIHERIVEITGKSNEIKKQHGFIWFHLTELEKEMFLVNYMQQLGYVITREEAKASVRRKKPTRRRGERPQNNLKARVKS